MFASHADQQAALSLNGHTVDGREISVQVAKAMEPSSYAKPTTAFTVVESGSACQLACAKLSRERMIVLDCEGVNLGKEDGQLCLVQIASVSAGIYLFDVIHVPRAVRCWFKGPIGERTRCQDHSRLQDGRDCTGSVWGGNCTRV